MNSEMKSLICKQPYQFEYASVDTPELKPGHAIVKIKRIGICGTDLHAYEGTQPYFNYPRILGHELSGDVIDFDKTRDVVPGDRVTLIPYFNCGACIACRNNKPNCCVNIRVSGVHIDGGMVEYFSVPSYSLVNGKGLNYDELALIEPLAIGAHGIHRAGIKEGEFALVIGAGPIGLGTMEFAKIACGRVIAMDIIEERLQFCREKLNVECTINANDKPKEQLQDITHGDMPVVVIDATGNQKAINNALQYVAHGGRYVLVGLQKDELIFSHPEFHKRETTLMSSRNATRQDFEHVINCLERKLIDPSIYITHRVKFDKVKDEFEGWLNPGSGLIKAMVEMD
jgi:2-desacetyl-2-hydroxyethyl bacteriochlorophyllide A dehydrogenase